MNPTKKTLGVITALVSLVSVGLHADAAPSVRWLETLHDFGAFAEADGEVTTRFRVVNTGDEPVAIIAARASCGCTAPTYDRAPLAPGDTAAVTVTYNPAGRPGAFHKYVAVEFNFPASRTKLDIRGTVIGTPASVATRYPVDCASGLSLARGAVMVGEVAKGRLKTVFMPVYNASEQTAEISFADYPPYIEFKAEPAAVPPGDQANVTVFFNSDRCPLYGLVCDSVTIRTGAGECRIPVTALVREEFTNSNSTRVAVARLTDRHIDIGTIGENQPVRAVTTLTNMGQGRLEIRRLYSADPGVSARASRTSLRPGQSTEIIIEASPEAIRGHLVDLRVNLIANDPANPEQTIRVSGEVAK